MNPLLTASKADTQLHLYLAWACPFCHRTFATLALTGLMDKVSITWMKNIKREAGWEIEPQEEPLFGVSSLTELYNKLLPNQEVRYSVPLLVDAKNKTVLSTDSPEITRYFSSGMNGAYSAGRELAPANLVAEIDALTPWLHDNVNRAAYLVGFATEQSDYENKLNALFQSLDELEDRLSTQDYLHGDTITESDVFLLASLERFDSIYFHLFKCCLRRIADYPALSAYQQRLHKIEALKATYRADLSKQHYFLSMMHINGVATLLNPSGTIPVEYQVLHD